ncbi:hypothetical protein FKR81_43095 [Lentzea tibetensis]|uniref:Uncharacterized protein n=1 Tax=Lentzea tibetensis TaxID=2591470 RepID=A0A563EFF5_9PSEU|nr:hypothetical protein FKR81_43095 [Lentzea tibetensis]
MFLVGEGGVVVEFGEQGDEGVVVGVVGEFGDHGVGLDGVGVEVPADVLVGLAEFHSADVGEGV